LASPASRQKIAGAFKLGLFEFGKYWVASLGVWTFIAMFNPYAVALPLLAVGALAVGAISFFLFKGLSYVGSATLLPNYRAITGLSMVAFTAGWFIPSCMAELSQAMSKALGPLSLWSRPSHGSWPFLSHWSL